MKTILSQLLLLSMVTVAFGQDSKPAADNAVLYQNNFESIEPGKLPEDFMVMEGAWAVKQDGGNKVLEIPGAPLDTFGVLFGPTTNSGIAVSARIYGTATGRRCPSFGLGLNGVAGYKLTLAPGRRALELYKGDELLTQSPCLWATNAWTQLELRIRQVNENEWAIEGVAWKQGDTQRTTLKHVEKTTPTAGRPSLWGTPISSTPIRFDDLQVISVKG